MVEYSELHPFAYRVHTHKLGSVVSGYIVQDGKWELLGKRDPNTPQVIKRFLLLWRLSRLFLLTLKLTGNVLFAFPQMFYPVANDQLTITPGDILAARCTMKNDNDHAVEMG